MNTLKTISGERYTELREKVSQDVDAEKSFQEAHTEVCRLTYLCLGGKLTEGFPTEGKSLKKLAYKNYLAIFGEKDYSGNTLYNARLAHGIKRGESELDDDGKPTANAQVHVNCRQYLNRIRKGIRQLVDPQMAAWPAKPKSQKAKKKQSAKELNRQAKIATDPKFAAQERAREELLEKVAVAVEKYSVASQKLDAKLAEIKEAKIAGTKPSKLSDLTLVSLTTWTKAFEDAVGVIDGRLSTRKIVKKKAPRRSRKSS